MLTSIGRVGDGGRILPVNVGFFIVDVVPAFNRSGGGYLIPNSISQRWISTNPKKHDEIWTAQNAAHNGDLIPLIKMIKAWNKSINNFFQSFHLEVMALQILQSVRISSYSSGVRYFFDKGRTYVIKQNPDPAGYKHDVGAYLNTQQKIDNAVRRFETAYKRALLAEDWANRYYITTAIQEWRKIFGNYFPL